MDFSHDHDGVQPHRHVHLSHNKNDPGVPPTAEEIKLVLCNTRYFVFMTAYKGALRAP